MTDLIHGDPGCWASIAHRRAGRASAVFLDRDGVVVEEVGYLRRVEDVALAPAAASTIAALNRAGVPVVVVTNQSGVARGYLDWSMFKAIQAEIDRRLAGQGARIDAVFACGYHRDGSGALAVADHPWRKPNPGMFLAAAARLDIALESSAIVGDRAQDLAAGRAAGLSMGLHVATGHGGEAGEDAAARALGREGFEVRSAADIGGVLGFLPRLVLPAATEG